MWTRIITLAVLSVIMFPTENVKTNTQLTGNIKNAEEGAYLYLREFKTFKPIDSFKVVNEKISYNLQLQKNRLFILHNKRNKYAFRDRKLLWVEPDTTLIINGNYNFLQTLTIKGSNPQKKFNKCKKVFNAYGEKIDSLYQEIKKGGNKEKIEKEINSVKHLIASAISKYPRSILNNIFTILLLYPRGYFGFETASTNDILDIYHYLPDDLKNKNNRKKFNKYFILPCIPNKGKRAPDIVQQTPEGETIKLSDLRGKYVLVEFWASWCKPCRESFTGLKKVYKKYKSREFEIYAVSGDKNKASWKSAIKQDSLPWINVSDLKGMKNQAFINYKVSGVPRNFLIDKKGVIIRKHFRDHERLDKELEALFKNE